MHLTRLLLFLTGFMLVSSSGRAEGESYECYGKSFVHNEARRLGLVHPRSRAASFEISALTERAIDDALAAKIAACPDPTRIEREYAPAADYVRGAYYAHLLRVTDPSDLGNIIDCYRWAMLAADDVVERKAACERAANHLINLAIDSFLLQ